MAPSPNPDVFGAKIIGESSVMQDLAARAQRAAESDLSVLITGDTGTGKELLARAIHEASHRRGGPFISETCGALPEGLLEAELFGHEAGAFTGARDAREGLFERASGGTLFIDEISDTTPGMQAKLLRVLQEGEVRRIGGNEPVPVDVRVIASTQENLGELVQKGEFRRDLLFRVAVVELHVPPLRERLEDLPLIADRVLEQVAAEEGGPRVRMTQAALDRLLSHSWPGNVRELENVIRVGALFSGGDELEADALRLHEMARPNAPSVSPEQASYQELLDDLVVRERAYVVSVLKEARGNKALAARTLGITRYALYRTLKRLGLEEEKAKDASHSDEGLVLAG